MKLLRVLIAGVILACVGVVNAEAQCVVDTSTPTYSNGTFLRYHPCNENGALKIDASSVRTLTIASGVTTNTTSTPVAGVRGSKTYWAKVDGTGAVTATVQFNGCHTAAATYCVVLGMITLSGTTTDYDVPSPANGTADYPYLGITTTNVTGTSATVVAGVNY